MAKVIYESWLRIHGWLLGGLSLFAGIGAYYWTQDWKLLGKLMLPVAILAILFCILFIDAFVRAHGRVVLPRIIRVIPAQRPYASHSCILVTESSPVFGHDSFVTIYRSDEDCEILTAHGVVLNRQENGYLQIGITFLAETEPEVVNKIKRNDSAAILRLLVKPTITRYALEASK